MSERDTLFSLTIDPVIKSDLFAAARWARLLAILSIVVLLMSVAAGLFQYYALQQYDVTIGISGPGLGVAIVIMYLLFVVVAFFPIMYMLRFSGKLKWALNSNDQQALTDAFKNLKFYFRFLGIIIIISLLIMAGLLAIAYTTLPAFT